MSRNIQDILMQVLGGARQPAAPVPTQSPGYIPSLDWGAANPDTPRLAPEDLIASPDPTQPHPPDVRMEGFRRMLTDFTFSLGSGLSAASQNPRGRAQRNQAGMGAILQVPEQLRRQKVAEQSLQDTQAHNALDLILKAKQADTASRNQASLEQYRVNQDQNADNTNARITNQNAETNSLKDQILQMQLQTQKDKEEIANRPKKIGQANGVDGNGKPFLIDVMQKSDGTLDYISGPDLWVKPTASKLLTPEELAQRKEIAQANRVDQEQVVQFESPEGPRYGILNKKTGVIMPTTAAEGASVTPKLPQIPGSLKTQATAASTALAQVDNIEQILKSSPQLVGPVAGRFGDFMRGVGKNPFIGTADERMGAQLAGHMNALFAQELRSLFPGRTNEQMQELIKSTSARISQDPNQIFGELDTVRFNEGLVIENAKRQGWVPERASEISTGPKPAAAAPGGVAPEGTVVTNAAGQKMVKRGGQWVNQ